MVEGVSRPVKRGGASGLRFLAAGVFGSRRALHRTRRRIEEAFLHRFPQVEIALGEPVEHRPRRLAENVVELTAELLLLVEEDLQALLEIAAHEALHRISVEADDLRQQLRREHRLPGFLVLGDDLEQHGAGQVVAGLGVADFELLAVDDELPHFFERDVARNFGVVETPIRIFLDDANLCHAAKLADCAAAHQRGCCATLSHPHMKKPGSLRASFFVFPPLQWPWAFDASAASLSSRFTSSSSSLAFCAWPPRSNSLAFCAATMWLYASVAARWAAAMFG